MLLLLLTGLYVILIAQRIGFVKHFFLFFSIFFGQRTRPPKKRAKNGAFCSSASFWLFYTESETIGHEKNIRRTSCRFFRCPFRFSFRRFLRRSCCRRLDRSLCRSFCRSLHSSLRRSLRCSLRRSCRRSYRRPFCVFPEKRENRKFSAEKAE